MADEIPRTPWMIRGMRGSRSQEMVVALVESRFPGLAGVTATALSHWEHGRRAPPPRHLLALVDLAVHPPSTEDLLYLLAGLAAREDTTGRQYRALLSSWAPDLGAEARVAAFRAWANAHGSRPPRGARQREAAANRSLKRAATA